MKKLYKAALLAVLGLASVSAIQAATYPLGDLIIGFTAGTGNDVIYDLGAESSLVNGQTWNLSSLLSSYSSLSTVSWGVIGDNTGTPRVAWTTTGGSAANTYLGNTAWNNLNNATKALYQNFSAAGAGQSLSIAVGDPSSWNTETISGALTTDYVNAYENPNVTGLVSDSFWSVLNDGSAPTLLGGFKLDSTGTVTFNTVSVPEPATYGMLAGAGLLMVSLRNQLRRKQA